MADRFDSYGKFCAHGIHVDEDCTVCELVSSVGRTTQEQIDAISSAILCTRCGADLRNATKYIGPTDDLCGDCYTADLHAPAERDVCVCGRYESEHDESSNHPFMRSRFNDPAAAFCIDCGLQHEDTEDCPADTDGKENPTLDFSDIPFADVTISKEQHDALIARVRNAGAVALIAAASWLSVVSDVFDYARDFPHQAPATMTSACIVTMPTGEDMSPTALCNGRELYIYDHDGQRYFNTARTPIRPAGWYPADVMPMA